MVRITKTMQPKHFETLSPWLKEFRDSACSTVLPLLPKYLATFPSRWPFPRGDLYHWISLLNRFDVILENFCKTYELDEGPQTTDFGCKVLEATAGEPEADVNLLDLAQLGYSESGDRELIESILGFSRMLLQNCGNRSLYASSSHLNSLLNTTSLSLLESTLVLGIELAQRYQAAVKRMNVNSKHQAGMLQNHYNINLDKVNQLAMPFSKKVVAHQEQVGPTTPVTPSGKGKEKAYFNSPAGQRGSTTTVYATDLVSMIKGGSGTGGSPTGARNGVAAASQPEVMWDDWGDIKLTYYPKSTSEPEPTVTPGPPRNATSSPAAPVTPTPIRRASNLGPHGHRPSRVSSSDDAPRIPIAGEDVQRLSFKTIEISSTKLKSSGVHSLIQQNVTDLAPEFQYELLTKLRVADALTSSLEARQQLLVVRLLAITNLAYIHQEPTFIETVLKQDSDEPRRLQLAYQLAELVHPPAEGDVAVPRPIQTVAFCALDALSQHQTKYSDVCAALNTNVNHGVLLYVIRKAVAGMSVHETGDKTTEEDEWRDALFSLISDLSVMPRTGGDLVTAGLIPILVEILNLRTPVAERYQPKVLSFLDTIMYSARDAFQTLVNADGLDAVSNLIVFQVTTTSEKVESGKGMQSDHRSATVDYEVPYFQQQALKWLFKFIHHMMSSAGAYGNNFDRLLRNLIDSSPLLGSLREIISNAHRFGSIVWTNAVSILNDFINNEPTSFAVIAEAGLSKGLLEAVTCKPIDMPAKSKKSEPEVPELDTADETEAPSSPHSDEEDSDDEYGQAPDRPTLAELQTPREGPLARGIMPTAETISIVPQAFGAICLNNAGMKMFQASGALESFFEVFESPEHVKCMDSNRELPTNLGSTFDELVRHHPPLKTAIMNAILNMVTRVSSLCNTKAANNKTGTKLWTLDAAGNVVIADKDMKSSHVQPSAKGKGTAVDESADVEMVDADVPTENGTSSSPPDFSSGTMTPFIAAVASFLSTICANSAIRSEFSAKGGIEFVLDLADSPCITPDFADGTASRSLQNVIALLAEQKPHLTMPSLLRRAQVAADVLLPFATHQGSDPFFKAFVNREAQQSESVDFLARGSEFAKAMVTIHSLIPTLHSCFQTSAYSHRNSNLSFNQLNLGDYYVRLVKSLGPLLGASFREELYLDKVLPDSYKDVPRPSRSFFASSSSPSFDDYSSLRVFPPVAEQEQPATQSSEQLNGDSNTATPAKPPLTGSFNSKSKALTEAEMQTPEFKNFQILRHLLSKVSRTISPFFQTLGKSLVNKRGTADGFQKQSHGEIATALAEILLAELNPEKGYYSFEGASHWMGIVDVLKDVLVDVSRHTERPVQTITLVLQAFKEHDGFKVLNKILKDFANVIQTTVIPPHTGKYEPPTAESMEVDMAVMGMRSILSLYGQIVSGKNVTEATQTVSMTSREGRDRTRPEFFSPSQFVVELRMAVLPTVRSLWESNVIDKAPSDVSEKLIDVIKTIATADNESAALKRTEKPWPVIKPQRKTFKIHNDHLTSIVAEEHDRDLGIEALYRCNNHISHSLEYCREVQAQNQPRYPVPEGDITPEEQSVPRPRVSTSTGTATPDESAAAASNAPVSQEIAPPPVPEGDGTSNFDLLLQQLASPGGEPATGSFVEAILATEKVSPATDEAPVKEEALPPQITVDDLNDERTAIRDHLIDRCLDVINAHGEVTFEVADLISTVVNKSPDQALQREKVGETLVVALMSFAGEEDLNKSGKKISAYAHLLALMLRDKLFYRAAVGELKENLSTLLAFVKLSPNHSADEPSPWIAQILLIVEMLLSEDARPRKILWSAPRNEDEALKTPVLEVFEPAVPEEEQAQLLEAILDILPRIGKDESLALSVLRILVILTRSRPVAQSMGEKKNIQRLFVMAKQLAGANSTRIQSPLMLILRHIIEDEESIKQIMRSEIKAYFELTKAQRSPPDCLSYLRVLAHVPLRAPQLFVDVTNEIVKYSRWSYSASEPRPHSLALKEPVAPQDPPKPSDDTVQPTVQATEDLSLQDVKPSTEGVDSELQDVAKAAHTEQKLPVVENPDGVIHFLLCELLNYKDVEDKDPATAIAPPALVEAPTASTNGDVAMADTPSGSPTPGDALTATPRSAVKAPNHKNNFRAEEHPIYIYRCFLLQCLTELLGSYNRTKIEFINFKRSAPPQAMTPSKPRSSVVNYLLFDLIPLGTLDTTLTTTLQKKMTTSSWADSVITALLAKTGEQSLDRDREESDGDDEPDLLFVRKFVLENILKAYKEASTSTEPLDSKYARMFSLAELMEHIMNEKDKAAETPVSQRSHIQLRRLMFEKGFITALTASIADVDLNFPSAKRAVKQILKPLKVLTNTAVHLSDLSLISSTPGPGDEEEIESATSVSDVEDDREETPDLFRNSTLGMFEPGREEDSSSESEDDDEEMYEDGYGDEMEYDEEPEDDEDNISEEDDIDGMGPIEGLSGDHNLEVEVVMDDDDEDDDDEEEDDEEESSDDDHDSEDDDARVEIIDEAGNIQEIEIDPEEGMEDWEDDVGDDDDGEEEDYEGEAEDADEEAQIHSMEAMMGGGPLGDLVRALGGGNAGHLEMADQIDEEMRDEIMERADLEDGDDERIAAEYMEEEDDDEEDVDEMMEEEEMFLGGNYPGPDGGPIFGWEGEEPPVIVHRGHRPRHGFPSPFPFLPGARDPLGGTSLFPSLQDPVNDAAIFPFLQQLAEDHIQEVLAGSATQANERVMGRLGMVRRSSVPRPSQSRLHVGEEGESSEDVENQAPPAPRLGIDIGAAVQNSLNRLRDYSRAIGGRANQSIVPGEFRYRSHRPGQAPGPRTTEDGTNPLLQRPGPGRASRDATSRIPTMGSWIQAMAPPGAAELLDLSRGGPFGESPATAALLEMLRSLPEVNLPGTISRNGAALQFHISTGPSHEVPPELRALFGLRASRYEGRRETTEPGHAAFFIPQTTIARWTEEAKILFGGEYQSIALSLKTAIDAVLVPPAIEAEKVKKAAETERVRKLEEEVKKRQEEDRLAREAKEAEEKIAREKKEAEEAETAARLAAEALAERGDDLETMQDEAADPSTASETMEGIEGSSPTNGPPADETPAEDRPRVTTVIRGNTMDITDLGIDPEFLAELPEELREEVIMSAVAERRSQAAATGAQPSEIDQEFLDALPEDIRDEIIQSERQERRRREREEQRRQVAANGGPAAVPDMDAASILATLPPALRQQVLMEQDEDMLNLLPQDIADQARAAQREHPAHHGRGIPSGMTRRAPPLDPSHPPHSSQRPTRRIIVQMLDKSGIATLLRLMFTFQVNNLRSALNSVLENVCLNRHNRTEVLGTLLSILQDGSVDMPAVERSFQQLSIRAKQPKEKEPKTPQPLKRTFTGMSSSVSLIQSVSEGATPLLVVQQCLSALNNLTTHNPHVPAYFLTEHDIAGGLKRSLSRKGKGKENKAGKYAINSLLSLLDRDLIMESSSIMEALSTLLSQITAPLQALQRKQKEAEEAAKKAAAAAIPKPDVSSTAEETSLNNEQPSEQPSEQIETTDNVDVPASGDAPIPEAPVTAGEGSPSEAPKPDATPKESEKKPRQITPPVIPEQNLKLVINIFIARECSSRTFRETLSTIKNLSAIPGAKAVFGRELITKAQGLGEIILEDLVDLLPQIQKATTGTEIQGVALAKFSPGGSDQNKLLRVLTALDHLFDPKRDKKDQPADAEAEGESSQKQDLLSSLYENSTFGPMWEKLSACLSAIRQREHMLNVATILLPLIEALMVVCKNTTLKDAPFRQGKEMLLTSPPPESRMESLFFTFTEEHRKILNDLVRHTPKLMSGTFSLLVKNPKVLDFDNKRNYFSRSIHSKAPNSRQAFPALQLSVRRDQIFHDSFKSLYFQTGDQMKYGKLSIRFHGEEGVDAGGVTREWFQVLARQMFDPGYALFIPVSSDRTTFHPNQLSGINDEHLMFFKFIGRVIGKALYEGRVLDCHFSRAVYKRILGKSVSVKDMESLDPDYYKSLIWMLENDITDIITETFSVDNDKFGVVETIDFIPNGRNVAVTQENKHEYVRLMVEWKLTGSVKEQLDEFLKGFHEIIPAELVAIFNEQELELLISGLPEIDVDDWKSNTEYHNYTASSPQIQWFWRAIRSYDKEERAKLLQFVTGTSKVPLNGFQELEGMNGFSRFNIHRDYGNKERLPSSHTCFNQLDLPEYESYESLRSHILTAITAGSEYFGFA